MAGVHRGRPERAFEHLGWALRVGLLLTAVLAASATSPASAHEERAAGDFRLEVGWGEEPAYTGLRNSVQVTVSDAGGARVTDPGDSLEVEVIKGSETITLALQAGAGTGGPGVPGDYRAPLTPTRPGTYTLRVVGSIRGQSVDETFTSSPTTFDEVQDAAVIQFPAKDPTPGQLATRIDREVPRLDARTAAVEAAVDRVESARPLAIVGMVVATLGLLTAAGALICARRGSLPGGDARVETSDDAPVRAGSNGR